MVGGAGANLAFFLLKIIGVIRFVSDIINESGLNEGF